MSLIQLNEMLARLGETNDGTNHISEYALYQLPEAHTLSEALDRYFSRQSTSITPAQPAESWHIRTTPVNDSAETLRLAARHWFYEWEYSEKVDRVQSDKTISEFISQLHSVVDDALVFEVRVEPPMWYECVWQDFAFDGGTQRWLLHLGFSD